MRTLLDTNIVIHREAPSVINEDIGVLFKWLDDLQHTKCIHPVTVKEINDHQDARARKTLNIKLRNYNVLKTQAPLATQVQALSNGVDEDESDRNDTLLLNELYCGRVDMLITEDGGIIRKASSLGVSDRVYTIEAYLEKVTAENPGLADYKVLAVQKELFGNLNVRDDFFQSLRDDYQGFDDWFNKKADEPVYICHSDGKLTAFLYLKIEHEDEDYSDISPLFLRKKRLKIGTLKVSLNGSRLGERFLKIVFDNALRLRVHEIYVTTFVNRIEQQRLVNLLRGYGFVSHGHKGKGIQREEVYVRCFAGTANRASPNLTYPFCSTAGAVFIVPIYPGYHTELFPDSILRNESPNNFVENEPHRNAIRKVYISRSIERNLRAGDVLVFYRTGGFHKSVVTTIGIVESTVNDIPGEADFIRMCRKRSVFSDKELSKHWNDKPRFRPFIVNLLYAYSFPKRINLRRLIEIGVIADIESAPRGFTRISVQKFRHILRECQVDESIVVD